jgi:Zn-dependent M28 family amino/carboxypeptidase
MKLLIRDHFTAVFFMATLIVIPAEYCMTVKKSFASENLASRGEIQNSSNKTMDMQSNLRKTVNILAKDIGSRSYLQMDSLRKAAGYIVSELERYGYHVATQSYDYQGNTYKNIIAEIKGDTAPEKILVVGAHYDSVTGTPGADDNASGIAGLLELARQLNNRVFDRTVRFVAFALEEPPVFRSRFMGSYVYAKSLNEKGEDVEGMICLEMIGYFTDTPGSQVYPLPFFRWFYPDKGNFIILVSNLQSRGFVNRVKSAFKKGASVPVESISTVSIVPGVDFSDHRSFWKFGYDALMVTDTAFYRNPHYHGAGDIPETLDYGRMAEVVLGLKSSIVELGGSAR